MSRGGGRSSSGGRSGGGGGGMFGRGPARSTAAPPRPAARPQPRPAAPQQSMGGGAMSGMGGMLASGMALGAGSAVGHAVVGSMLGGGGGHGQQQMNQGGGEQMQQQQQQYAPQEGQFAQQEQIQEQPCQSFNMNFIQCLKSSSNEIGLCQDYMNMLQQCEKDQALGGRDRY